MRQFGDAGAVFLCHALKSRARADAYQPAVLSEIATFAAGAKPALRVVTTAPQAAELANAAWMTGFHAVVAEVHVVQKTPTWATIVGLDQGRPRPATLARSTARTMVCIGRSDAETCRLNAAEQAGDTVAVGEALGYPLCCVTAFSRVFSSGPDSWVATLCATTSDFGAVPLWANRLATEWGGACPVGELYPCSLRCTAAIELGMAAISALRSFGLNRLADHIVADAKRPLWFDEELRSVSLHSADNGRGRWLTFTE